MNLLTHYKKEFYYGYFFKFPLFRSCVLLALSFVIAPSMLIAQHEEKLTTKSFISIGGGFSFFWGLDNLKVEMESSGFSQLKEYGIFDEIESGLVFNNNLLTYGGYYRRIESNPRNEFESNLKLYNYGLFFKYGRDILIKNDRVALYPSLAISYSFSQISIFNYDTTITSLNQALFGSENTFVTNSIKGDWCFFLGFEWSYLFKSRRDKLENMIRFYSRYCLQSSETNWPITSPINRVNNLEFGFGFARVVGGG